MTATATTTSEKVPSRRVQGIAITTAAFGQNAILTIVSTFIVGYLVQSANLSSGAIVAAGIIVGAAKAVDAVSDPVVGSLIDRTRTRWGKFRPYILFAALPVAILTTLMFSVPNISQTGKLVYFGVVFIVWGIAYSFCDVPLWGLIGSAFGDSLARAGVISRVRIAGSVSLGIVTLGMLSLVGLLSFGKGTTDLGWTLSVGLVTLVGIILYLLAFFFVRERPAVAKQEPLTFRQLFGTLFRNRPLMMVLLGSIVGFGRLIVQAGGTTFAAVAYGEKNATGNFTLIGASILIGVIAGSAFTPLLLRRTTSKQLVIWSSIIGAIVNLAMFLVGFNSLYVFMGFIFLSGLTLGVFQVVQPTLIADAVDNVEQRTGIRNDGISFSTLTFVSKLMTAVALGVITIIIGASGYHAHVHVTGGMQETVWIGIALVPAISSLLSAIPFWFYRLPATTSAVAK
jgi:sugar (glycoside-pentoside-hexuronide) transporter